MYHYNLSLQCTLAELPLLLMLHIYMKKKCQLSELDNLVYEGGKKGVTGTRQTFDSDVNQLSYILSSLDRISIRQIG